jgi:hypothetical protein
MFAVLLAASVAAAAADSPRYGSPSGCAGKPTTSEPYLIYDGAKLITSNTTCVLAPAGSDRVTAQCDGPQGKYAETYTLIATATSLQIFRENGTRLLGLPRCP